MLSLIRRPLAWLRRFLAWLRGESGRPALTYVDPSGQGWVYPPDYQDAHVEDHGQNDLWKREMRFAMWRWRYDLTSPGVFPLRDIGLSDYADQRARGELFPIGTDLACACRRIGFARLAVASGALDGLDPDTVRSKIQTFHAANEIAAQSEAERRFAVNTETAKGLPAGRPFDFDTIEQTLSLLSLGPVDAFAECPPMRVLGPVAPAPAVSAITGARRG